MARTLDDVLNLYKQRRVLYEPLHAKMREIADVYNGRAEVALPDMERPDEKPSIPNLLQQGVDQMAGRITSVTPQITFASTKPGTRKYDRQAKSAADTIGGWWQLDRLTMKQKQRGRRLVAYAMTPTVIGWDYKEHRPTWRLRHPLEALPSPDLQPGQVRPQDCIFYFQRTAGWMVANGYGEHLRALTNDREEIQRDTRIGLVEYIDADQTMLIATGHFPSTNYADATEYWGDQTMRGVLLEWVPNLIGEAAVTVPTRLTLDKMTGQFDGMIGMYYQQAKLMALETIAVEKGIFPDTYLVSRPGEMARFIDGPHDGRSGMINIIQGGDIQTEQPQPGYLTNPTIDRLERAQRVTSGIPQEFGGESTSNIRTGRRGDAVLSATIDFPIAEAQEIFAYALEEENEIAMRLSKRIDGSEKRTIFVGAGNARRPVTYVPTETFEQEEHVVSYPAAGTDVNSLILGIGQRVGLGIMSKRTAANLDPYIDNPEQEHDTIISEGLEQALMAGIQMKAQNGEIPPLVLAKIMTLVGQDKMELAEAMNKVTEEALAEEKRKQEAQMQGGGADPMSPDAAMAGPAAQAMTGAPPSAVPGVGGGMKDLATMLGDLRRPNMTITPQRGVAQGAM